MPAYTYTPLLLLFSFLPLNLSATSACIYHRKLFPLYTRVQLKYDNALRLRCFLLSLIVGKYILSVFVYEI